MGPKLIQISGVPALADRTRCAEQPSALLSARTQEGCECAVRESRSRNAANSTVTPLPRLADFLTLDPAAVPFETDVSALSLNVVDLAATSTACFTKSYGHCIVGCGSYLRLESGGLRLFTPREVASLMCFPPSFTWPEQTTTKQLYRALGNSVNVRVVSTLLQRLLSGQVVE